MSNGAVVTRVVEADGALHEVGPVGLQGEQFRKSCLRIGKAPVIREKVGHREKRLEDAPFADAAGLNPSKDARRLRCTVGEGGWNAFLVQDTGQFAEDGRLIGAADGAHYFIYRIVQLGQVGLIFLLCGFPEPLAHLPAALGGVRFSKLLRAGIMKRGQ